MRTSIMQLHHWLRLYTHYNVNANMQFYFIFIYICLHYWRYLFSTVGHMSSITHLYKHELTYFTKYGGKYQLWRCICNVLLNFQWTVFQHVSDYVLSQNRFQHRIVLYGSIQLWHLLVSCYIQCNYMYILPCLRYLSFWQRFIAKVWLQCNINIFIRMRLHACSTCHAPTSSWVTCRQ